MPGQNTPDRLKAVEEEIGQTEIRTDQLDQAVRDLSAQILELTGRLDRLERRVLDQATPADDVPDEPPPHSHRPA